MTESEFQKRFIAARRKIIAADFPQLNEMQLKAVMTTEGPLLILAGAGSGKTTVLINRTVNLLRYGRGSDTDEVPEYVTEEDLAFLESFAENPDEAERARAVGLCAVEPAEPWRVMAITFTNKAADELKNRLERAIGPDSRDIWAATFHSACVRILRRDIERLGYDRSFTIYDTSDSIALIKRILKEQELDDKSYPPRSVLSQISRLKDEMQSAEDFADAAEKDYDVRRKKIAGVYTEYQNRLRASNALDFDDIILLTVQLLLQYTDVREYYQRKFRYVLVDEYQDTNKLQYMLTSLLAGGYENICVVGDDDQSIYKFRGATIANILSFEENYRGARVIRLEQNYRSTGHILEAANAVIKNNQGRKGKTLWTDRGDGELITLYIAENENDEAQYVAGKILAGISEGANFRDFAVLYRMNVQSNQLEHAFRRNGIPYRVFGGMKFFDRAEVKDMLAYLCVLNNPADDLRLARIINNPPRGIGTTTVERAQAMALSEGISLYEVLRTCRERPELQRAAGKIVLFIDMIEELREALATMSIDEAYDLLVSRTGYVRMLEEKNTEEDRTRIENVRELKTNIMAFIEAAENPTLSGFLEEIALYTDLEQLSADGDAAVMMTMHSAKGLEFPTVFIVGAEDGLFPGIRAIGDQDEMEEERRLCYVGMTRAERKLYITSARQRMLYGRTNGTILSRFVEEIPDGHLDRPAKKHAGYVSATPSSGAGFSSYAGRQLGTSSPRHSEPAKAVPAIKKPEPPKALSQFGVGDAVEHKAFGHGVIALLKPMPGDALIEVDFDKVGRKKLMLKSAAQFMKKV